MERADGTDSEVDEKVRENGTFVVTIRRCVDLFDADTKGNFLTGGPIDPFVKVRPSWEDANKVGATQKTKCVNDGGRQPVFLPKHQPVLRIPYAFRPLSESGGPLGEHDPIRVEGNMVETSLHFEVLDEDMLGDPDFIGEGTFPLPREYFSTLRQEDKGLKSKEGGGLTGLEVLLTIRPKKKKFKSYKKYFSNEKEFCELRMGKVIFDLDFEKAPDQSKQKKAGKSPRTGRSPRPEKKKSARKSPRAKGGKSATVADPNAKIDVQEVFASIKKKLAAAAPPLDIQTFFDKYDTDNSDSLSADELKKGLSSDCALNENEIAALLYRFDIEDFDGIKTKGGSKKSLSYDKLAAAVTGKVTPGSNVETLLSGIRERIVSDPKVADYFKKRTSEPYENEDFVREMRNIFCQQPIETDLNEIDEERQKSIDAHEEEQNIKYPEDYADLVNFFDFNGDRTIDGAEVIKGIGKGIFQSIEERNERGKKEQAALECKPLPLCDEETVTVEEEIKDESGGTLLVQSERTEMIGPKPGMLEILCVRAQRLKDTSNFMDKAMDPYVTFQAAWLTQKLSTKPAKNMHQEPMWTEKSHGSRKFFKLTQDQINDKMAVGTMNIEVYDAKIGFDTKIGSCSLNVEKYTHSYPGHAEWSRVRCALQTDDSGTAGDLHLQIRYIRDDGIKIKKEARKGATSRDSDAATTHVAHGDAEKDAYFFCPGVFAIQFDQSKCDKELLKDLNKTQVQTAVIPRWLGASGMQTPAFPQSGVKAKRADFQFPGALGQDAFEEMKENLSVKFEISTKTGGLLIKDFELAYIGELNRDDMIKHFPEMFSPKTESTPKKKVGGKGKEDMISVPVTMKGKDGKDRTLWIKIKFSKTDALPPTATINDQCAEVIEDRESTAGTLEVTIIEARNLIDTDIFSGSADPYVELQLLPVSRSETCSRLEKAHTRVYKDANTKVQMNETFTFPMYLSAKKDYNIGKRDRAGNLKLKLELKDKDFLCDDSLGVLSVDISSYLRVGSLPEGGSVQPPVVKKLCKSIKGKIETKTQLKYSVKFTKADPEKSKKLISEREGKFQILAMDGKNLKNVEGIFGGKNDPRFEICFMTDDALHAILAGEDRNAIKKLNWSKSAVHDGAGKTPFWHEWLEVEWPKRLSESATACSAIIAVWDANIGSSTFIGATRMSISDLLDNAGGNFIPIYAGDAKKPDIKSAIEMTARENKVEAGRVRFAAQFVPGEVQPELVEPVCIKKGTFQFHVGEVRFAEISSTMSNGYQKFKMVIRQQEKGKQIGTELQEIGPNRTLLFNEKLSCDVGIPTTKISVSIVSEKSGKSIAELSLPAEVFYTAYRASCLYGNTVAQRWLPLVSTEDSSKADLRVSGCRVCLTWAYVEEDVSIESSRTTADPVANFFSMPVEEQVLKPACRPGRLKVRVHNATNLKGNQWFGKSDPYPCAVLLPENESKRFDKPDKDGVPNPKWDWKNKPCWEYLVDDATTGSLELQVCNFNESKGTYGPQDVIAKTTINVSAMLFDTDLQTLLPKEKVSIPAMRTYALSQKNATVQAEVWFEADGDGSPTHGFTPPTISADGTCRAIDLLPDPINIEKYGQTLDGELFLKPLQALNLRNVDRDGKNDIKVVCELFDGSQTPRERNETLPTDSAGESHEFDKTDMLRLKFQPEYLSGALAKGSTPFVRIALVDVDQKKKKEDKVVGQIDVPVLALLKHPGVVYDRKFVLMAPDGSGNRGKFHVYLQYLTADKIVSTSEIYQMSDEDIRSAKPPVSGTVICDVKAGRELECFSIVTRGKMPRHKLLPIEGDPKVRLRLSRGGFATNHIHRDQPDAAFHETYENIDGGASPQWTDAIPGSLVSHDIELDMLEVTALWTPIGNHDVTIGSFTVPLLEIASLKSKSLSGWIPLLYNGISRSGSLRVALDYSENEVINPEDENAIATQTGPKGFNSGKGHLEVTIIAARGMKIGNRQQTDYFVEGQIFPSECLEHQENGQWQTKVDEDAENGDVCVFNDRRQFLMEWKDGDNIPPVLKVSLKKKSFLGGKLGDACIDIAPFVLAPGQPAEFWVSVNATTEVKVAMRFDDSARKVDLDSRKVDSRYLKLAMDSVRNFNTIGNVHCMVLKTRNLRDVGGIFEMKNDPYVKVRVYGSSLKQEGILAQTRVKQEGGSNAKFDETLMFSVDNRHMAPGTCTTLMMDVQVFDRDEFSKDDFIGCVTIPVLPFQTLGGNIFENWFPLRSKKGEHGTLAGEVHLSTQWLPEGVTAGARMKLSGDRPLFVHVIRAEELLSVTTFDRMDPFVRIEIKDQDARVDSVVVEDGGKTPKWDAILPISLSDKVGSIPTIKVSVLEKDAHGETLIGDCEVDLTTDITQPLKVHKQDDKLRSDCVLYKTVPLTLELTKNGLPAGTLYVKLRRDEFEGIEGRDDGINRGAGETTIEEDFGEDEDDDGEADGRLHIQVVELYDFEVCPDFQGKKLKLRACMEPKNKFRKTKNTFELQSKSNKSGEDRSVLWFNPAKHAKISKTEIENFHLVMPYACNVGNRGRHEGSSLQFQIVCPGSLFKREKILGSAKIGVDTLDSLEVIKGQAPKPPATIDVDVVTIENEKKLVRGKARLKLTYIPFVCGKIRVSVQKANNLRASNAKDPRVEVFAIIDGKDQRKVDMKCGRAINHQQGSSNCNPEWINAQANVRYTNGRQKSPDYLVLRLKNLERNKTIGIHKIPFLDIVKNASGGEIKLNKAELRNEDGTPAGTDVEHPATIDANVMLLLDGTDQIEDSSAAEELSVLEDMDAEKKGEKPLDKKNKDLGRLLVQLKDMFYKIDVDGNKVIEKQELGHALSAKSGEIDEFLRLIFKQIKKTRPEMGGKEYNVENVIDMIEGEGGDDEITWEEWNFFCQEGVAMIRQRQKNLDKKKVGSGALHETKQKMNAVKDMISGFTKEKSAEQIRKEELEEKRRRERKKQAAIEKEEARKEREKQEKLDAIKRQHEKDLNAAAEEREKIRLKIAEANLLREEKTAAREEAKRVATEHATSRREST